MDCQPRRFSQPTTSHHPRMPAPDGVLLFGSYAFHVRQRLVMRDEKSLRLGGRALDILQILVEHAGEVVNKQVLISRVWPDSVVEEINLRVQIAALRRALNDGQRYIETLPQRGYRFRAKVTQAQVLPQPRPVCIPNNLPVRLTHVIGREQVVGKLVRQLLARRFVTLTGAGGVGKSTVACRVAERLVTHYQDGVCVIDVCAVDSEQALIGCLARLLKREGERSLSSLFSELTQGRRLLILDNCDALLESCRQWIEALLGKASELTILATSRQPLKVMDEQLFRLDPLTFPPATAQLNAEQGLCYSAVQLFISRVQACQHAFVLQDRDVKIVGDICRKLDGLPLAIELAAAQIDAFALFGLHTQLNQCVHWLTQGRRTAVPRHQSLKASLDWSYQRLSYDEQAVLRRLAVFKKCFSADSAVDVIGCDGLAAQAVQDGLAQLERHSLLLQASGGEALRYRLSHTARLYALEKLEHSGEFQTFTARHARHLSLHRWLVASAPSIQLVE